MVRPSEGVPVPVVLGQVANVNGLSIQTAMIKVADAPVPERKYVADVCGIEYVPGTVKMLFGQKRIGGDDLRSLLVIHMSHSGATRFLTATEQLTPTTLEVMAKQAGISTEASMPIKHEPSQTIAMAAGVVMLAASPEDTTMDFYQASSFALQAMRSGSISLDPVVRIDIRTSLLLGLISELRKFSAHFPIFKLTETTT